MWRFAIDTGGTFTDVIGIAPDGAVHRDKILSSSILKIPIDKVDGLQITLRTKRILQDDVLRGCRLGQATVMSSQSTRVELDQVVDIAPGDVVSIESHEQAPVFAMRLITGCPSGNLLPVGELRLGTTRGTNALLENSYPEVGLVLTDGFGDLLFIGDQRRPDLFVTTIVRSEPVTRRVATVPGRLNLDGSERQAIDLSKLKSQLQSWKNDGIDDLAVCLLHADVDGRHEQCVGELATQLGFKRITLSSQLDPQTGYLKRAQTTIVNAALRPVLDDYLTEIRTAMPDGQLRVMTSAGDLSGVANFHPKDGLLSGPAGGVVGALHAGREIGIKRLLSFDMGGTSTDVARLDNDLPTVPSHRVGEAELSARAVAVETVAAGGGSICWFDGFRLRVGPASAGADPGPACYGGGGPLTVTDCNLLLGRLDEAKFPWPLDRDAARVKLDAVMIEMSQIELSLTREEILRGLLDIVNESMAGAITRITRQQGRDPTEYALVAFGGAGSQHAVEVAELLGVTRVLIPEDAGILSARGMMGADVLRRGNRQVLKNWADGQRVMNDLFRELETDLRIQCEEDDIESVRVLACNMSLRRLGHDSVIDIPASTSVDEFASEYRARFGHVLSHDDVLELVSVSMDVGKTGVIDLSPDPVSDPYGVAVVTPEWVTRRHESGQLELVRQGISQIIKERGEAVDLELFAQRFTGIARDMGVTLQSTTTSTSVRERGDFSCAVLDAHGRLVVNAPHIPVHLGALGVCVRSVIDRDWQPGDALVTNHPAFGGSHLPDVTVISPVIVAGTLIGFVASRAHHAEIGGLAPGSMPANGRTLADEGVVFEPSWLCREGNEAWENIKKSLRSGHYPSRDPAANLADLRAQLQANRRGVVGLQNLCRDYGSGRIAHWMNELDRQASDTLTQKMLKFEGHDHSVVTTLDNGTLIRCTTRVECNRLSIDLSTDSSDPVLNLNAPRSVVTSVVVYVLRLLCECDIPLNEGLLESVDLKIGPGMLSPVFTGNPNVDPAVVGGNVETSQRLVDLILESLGMMAHSSGTMNNLLLGDSTFAYYETIGGGMGATPAAPGADGVQVHMTNTAITDAEILERRTPLSVERFELRRQSGGAGRFSGGDGLVREIRCHQPLTVSLLSERRTDGPAGLNGGGDGLPGNQQLIYPDGQVEEMPGRFTCDVEAGTVVRVETPGGGGSGSAGRR